MNTVLQKAIGCLQIRDVYLRGSESSLAPGFEPKYPAETESLSLQFKHLVTQSDQLLLQEDGEELRLFRVHVDLGTRWVAPQPDDSEPEVRASIQASFTAEYLLTNDPGKEALDAFALKNASYHVWPFWREYLMSQCVRMHLPKIALPAVQLAQNQEK